MPDKQESILTSDDVAKVVNNFVFGEATHISHISRILDMRNDILNETPSNNTYLQEDVEQLLLGQLLKVYANTYSAGHQDKTILTAEGVTKNCRRELTMIENAINQFDKLDAEEKNNLFAGSPLVDMKTNQANLVKPCKGNDNSPLFLHCLAEKLTPDNLKIFVEYMFDKVASHVTRNNNVFMNVTGIIDKMGAPAKEAWNECVKNSALPGIELTTDKHVPESARKKLFKETVIPHYQEIIREYQKTNQTKIGSKTQEMSSTSESLSSIEPDSPPSPKI